MYVVNSVTVQFQSRIIKKKKHGYYIEIEIKIILWHNDDKVDKT